MALIHLNFFSHTLGMCTSADVIIPQRSDPIDTPDNYPTYKVLFLLHGLSDDHTIWQRRTSIERYADEKGIAVVMPNCHRSWYTDMAHGGKYYTFISKELTAVCMNMFRGMSTKREDHYIAGLSMGGYGALKFGLSMPDFFSHIASFSGAVNVYERVALSPGTYSDVFGIIDTSKDSVNDLFYLAEKASKLENRPSVYMWCGTEDFLIEENRKFTAHLSSLGYEHTYCESSGNHSWPYWDEQIKKVLNLWF